MVGALSHPDLEVLCSALQMLAHLGTREHAAPIAELTRHEDPRVRAMALRTLGLIAAREPDLAPRLLPALQHGLHDGVRSCQQAAIFACFDVPCDDWGELEGLLADASWMVRLAAAAVLVRNGVRLHENDLASVLRDSVGCGMDHLVVSLFDQLDRPADGALIEPYLQSGDASVAFRATEAMQRITTRARGTPDWTPPSQQSRERYGRENRAAEAALLRLSWTEIDRSEVLAAVRSARLVVFGEIHESEGPLRTAQETVLRTMAASGGRLLLGYEPPVQFAQQSVLDLARELGVEVVPLEGDGWQVLSEGRRYSERDDDAARIVNTRLAADPECRMLVIRGESHVLPGGYLDRQLVQRPVFVLTVDVPPFAAVDDRPDLRERTFRRGDEGSVFFWGTMDLLAWMPELTALLADVP